MITDNVHSTHKVSCTMRLKPKPMGRPPKYIGKTVSVPFRMPEKYMEEIKEKIYKLLDKYRNRK